MALPMARCGCRNFLNNRRSYVFRAICRTSVAKQHTSTQTTYLPQSTIPVVDPPKKIVIPKRKKRDELSILKALASTVERDTSAPHYKYIDDPYLIPTSMIEKKTYSLSKASGQKAAQYVIDRYPGSFDDNPAEPTIEALMPKRGPALPEEEETGLRERIAMRLPTPAYQSYQKIKEQGNAVSRDAENELLELLCFHNSSDPVPTMKQCEQYYSRDMGQDNTKKIVKTWNDKGAAEVLFKGMAEPDARAYSSLIRGRAKYFQTDKAFELFREMQSKKLPIDLNTYNAVLEVSAFQKEQPEARWQLLQEILGQMVQDHVTPDLSTFNILLNCIARMRTDRKRLASWAMATINEMRNSGIEPSLASWYHVLRICYARDDVESNVLYKIVDHLQGKDLTLQHPDDLAFFSTAMAKCFYNMQDLSLAYKLDDILNHGHNYKLLGDGYQEGLFYMYFMRVVCMFEEIDTIMEHYDRITPNTFTPTFTVVEEILTAIELTEGYDYLPLIWSDLVLFDYTRRVDLVQHTLQIMAKKKHADKLQGLFVQVAEQVIEKYEDDKKNTRLMRPLQLKGPMIGYLSIIYLNSGNFSNAWKLFEIYQTDKNKIEGFISEEALVKLTEACIEEKDIKKSLKVLELMADCAYPAMDKMADAIQTELPVTAEDKNFIEDLL